MHAILETAVTELVNTLEKLHPLDIGLRDFFFRHCKIMQYNKGDFLLKPGSVCDAYYFIFSGQVRSYVEYGNKQITTWVSTEGELVSSIYSLRSRTPCEEYIEVLSKSILLKLDRNDLELLYKAYPSGNIITRKLLEKYYADAELRALIPRMPTAELKYSLFAKKFPHLLSIIPQKYIASFLGIRQETLSRLIKN
jgi:CRP-like cAMP-binding protein